MTHSKKQIAQIAKSIDQFGPTCPIIIDNENRIVAGHGRFEAAKLLALDSFPAIRLTDMNDAEIRAYALADNKLAENAGWDRSALAVELGELQIALPEFGLDLAITGFDPGYRANCQTAGPIGLIGGQRDPRRKSPGVPLLHFIRTVDM